MDKKKLLKKLRALANSGIDTGITGRSYESAVAKARADGWAIARCTISRAHK